MATTDFIQIPGLTTPIKSEEPWPFEQILYINLEDAPRRRERCETMLPIWFDQRPVLRFNAVNRTEVMQENYRQSWTGRLDHHMRRTPKDPKDPHFGDLHPSRRGTLACYFSHLAAWTQAAASGKVTLVTEDDIFVGDIGRLMESFSDPRFWGELPEDWAILRPNIRLTKSEDRIGTSPWFRPTPIVRHPQNPEVDLNNIDIWQYYFSCSFNIVHPERVSKVLEAMANFAVGDVDQESCQAPGVYFFDCDKSVIGDNFAETVRYT
jgi:GR25 family glycosyltransferase involved in LPS biosynthesis